MFIDLPWGQNCYVLIYQTAIIDYQGYVAHLHATLRARREKTLPLQSYLKNTLNDAAGKAMKNIDNNFLQNNGKKQINNNRKNR